MLGEVKVYHIGVLRFLSMRSVIIRDRRLCDSAPHTYHGVDVDIRALQTHHLHCGCGCKNGRAHKNDPTAIARQFDTKSAVSGVCVLVVDRRRIWTR